jgi:hypothetical protein
MAKAAKSRKSAKPARKSGGAKAKARKPAKAATKVAKPAAKVQAQVKTKKAAAPKAKPARAAASSRAVKTATFVADASQPIAAGAAATVLARPEPRGGRTESQPAESETPPALPVPIASFTF